MEARHAAPTARALRLTLSVHYRVLLAILAVAPLAGLFAVVDQLILHGTWHDSQHFTPENIVYWTAVLTLPHIVASMLSFADRDYLAWYRKPLLKGLGVSLALAFIGQIVLGGYASILILACYTMYHNVQQQFGIAAMTLRMAQTSLYKIMKWLFVIPSALGYVILMTSETDPVRHYTSLFVTVIGVMLAAGTVLAIIILQRLRRDPATPKIGVHYFIGNIAALYISFILLATGYGFLTTLISRLIHDLTAYVIYTTHDHNRQAAGPTNMIYAIPARLGIKPAWLCVPLALAISTLILMIVRGNMEMAAIVFAAMNFMHYYMEGHMWKRGTPHRTHVNFV